MIKIESTTETIESKGGLVLGGKIVKKAGLERIKSELVNNAGDVNVSLFRLMMEGKSDFGSMGKKRESLFFKEALTLPFVFAKETVRLYLERMAAEAGTVIVQLWEKGVIAVRSR